MLGTTFALLFSRNCLFSENLWIGKGFSTSNQDFLQPRKQEIKLMTTYSYGLSFLPLELIHFLKYSIVGYLNTLHPTKEKLYFD